MKPLMIPVMLLLSGSAAVAQNRQPAMGCKPVSSRQAPAPSPTPRPATTTGPSRPAAPGYIRSRPSNVNQDRQLKELEKSGN